MAKNLQPGDVVLLRWTVKNVWPDGDVSLTFPGHSIPITISANEIEEEDVTRKGGKKPPEPEQRTLYQVMIDREVLRTTEDRDEAHAMADEIEGARVMEVPLKPRKKR